MNRITKERIVGVILVASGAVVTAVWVVGLITLIKWVTQ